MIRIENVSKRFGAVRALAAVNLEVVRGERVALVGSNGSGKTTLLRAMLGLVRVEGRVLIDGEDVEKHPERALRRVAYVPQIAPPLEAPVRELLRTIIEIRGIASGQVERYAGELGLDFNEIAERRLRDLSGGMKQKLLAALALASDPELLICDEPTANLDAQARERFFELLAARKSERALILCSHRSDDVTRLVDRIVELEDGHVASDQAVSSAVRVAAERIAC